MNETELGEFHRDFSVAGSARSDLITGLLILVVFLPIAAFALSHTRPDQFVLGVVIVSLLLAGIIVFIVSAVLRLGKKVQYHEGGIVVVSGKRVPIRFDDIRVLRGAVPAPGDYGSIYYMGGPLTMELKSGRKVSLPFGIADSDTLYNIIHDEVLQRLLAPALAAIQAGHRLDFGPFTVDRSGLSFGGKELPWVAFEKVTFTPDNIQIHQLVAKGLWADVPIPRVPNANVFVELTRRLRA